MRRIGAACIIAAAGLGLLPGHAAAQPGSLKTRFIENYLNRPAPPFALKDVRGKIVRLEDFRGKLVLLNFWFSSCFPCRQETPDLVALHNVHRDKGLVILGINTDALVMPGEGGAMMRNFIETYRIPYPVLLADLAMYRAYGSAPVQPISFLIDRSGKIVEIFWGAFPGPAFDRAVRRHLGASPPARPPAGAGAGSP